MYTRFFKRVLDFFLASIGLVLITPIFLAVMLLLLFSNKGTPFFVQARPGKNARIFNLIKFKTMNDKKDAVGKLLPDVDRITKIGSFIRSTSLDELPQLINVIKGDMALIGPRPLLIKYLPLYSIEQARRHEVRPGISGWAQVNGRNSIPWETKFELDVFYVENLTFRLDIVILFKTLKKVFIREGISSATSITMEDFRGKVNKKNEIE